MKVTVLDSLFVQRMLVQPTLNINNVHASDVFDVKAENIAGDGRERYVDIEVHKLVFEVKVNQNFAILHKGEEFKELVEGDGAHETQEEDRCACATAGGLGQAMR